MRPIVLYICTDNEVFAGSSKSLLSMIKSLREHIYPIVLFSQGGPALQAFQEAYIETWVHPFTYVWQRSEQDFFKLLRHPKRHIFYQWHFIDKQCVNYVQEKLNGRHLALVHTNTSVVTIGVSIAKTFEIPHVWHIREFQDKDFNIRPFMGKIWLKHLIKKANARIYISNAVYKHWRIKSPNNFVIGNVIVDEKKPIIIADKQKYFLYCAAQVRESKGASLAVQAFCQSGLSKLGYVLALIGMCDTKYKETLINIAEKYNTDISCIQFLGYQSDVSPFFRDATAFLMCSTSEGLGRVTIEAMYYGCPVIAFASGGTTEIVKQNETGHLFLNKEELIKQMNEVTTNNQLTILHKAQDYAITNFGSKAIIPLVQSIYMKLIK